VTTEEAQATTTKYTILVEIQKYRGCLLFDALACLLQLRVKSKARKQFWMASHDKDAHHMDSILDSELDANLA
jgi:hypothetical protein